MKKYIIMGLILGTMFTGVACGSKAAEKSKVLEEAKIAVASQDYGKARNLFKLASDETEGEEKTLALNNYELLNSFVLAQKALEEKDIEEAKKQIAKIENDTTYPSLVEDIKELKKKIEDEEKKDKNLDEKLTIISNFIEEENLDGAKSSFAEIDIAQLSEEGNKKYADMSLKIKALEEKVEAKKEAEKKEQEAIEKAKNEKDKLLNGTSKIYIDYKDAGVNDSFESFQFRILSDGNLEMERATEKSAPEGTLGKVEENKWSGTLYDSAFLQDYLYEVIVTDDAIKVIQPNEFGTSTMVLYIKSKTYKLDIVRNDGNEGHSETGSFTLR
ncbi:MAG: hypothetical protein ACRCWM_10255 [Sarcina sp.]